MIIGFIALITILPLSDQIDLWINLFPIKLNLYIFYLSLSSECEYICRRTRVHSTECGTINKCCSADCNSGSPHAHPNRSIPDQASQWTFGRWGGEALGTATREATYRRENGLGTWRLIIINNWQFYCSWN